MNFYSYTHLKIDISSVQTGNVKHEKRDRRCDIGGMRDWSQGTEEFIYSTEDMR